MSRRGVKLPKRAPSSIFLAYESWPVHDQVLWQKARLKGSLLKEDGRAAHWRPDTNAKNELDYGRWLRWVARVHPDELTLSPTARVTQDRVKTYVEDLHGSLAAQSVSAHLLGLGFMMNALSDTGDFSWVTCAAQRLERSSAPIRNNRSRLRSPHDLVELGFRLMREAEDGIGAGGWPPAVTYRNGLIIALLAYRPIRLANLKGIYIGQQLRKCGDGFELHFTDKETKQHRSMELHLPASLSAPLTRYMAVHRPVLLACGPFSGTAGNALWVAADGGALSKAGIRAAVLVQTKKAFGKSLGPHLFRSCAATLIAIDDPAHAQDIAAILGHSTMATSERHYNQAQTIDAGRQYHTALRSRRLDLRSKRGRETAPC